MAIQLHFGSQLPERRVKAHGFYHNLKRAVRVCMCVRVKAIKTLNCIADLELCQHFTKHQEVESKHVCLRGFSDQNVLCDQDHLEWKTNVVIKAKNISHKLVCFSKFVLFTGE